MSKSHIVLVKSNICQLNKMQIWFWSCVKKVPYLCLILIKITKKKLDIKLDKKIPEMLQTT